MNKMIKILLLVSITLLFSACAGKKYVKPDEKSLILGKTTYENVINLMGETDNIGSQVKNNTEIKQIFYVYAIGGSCIREEGSKEDLKHCEGIGNNIIPARAMFFYFDNNKLVGYDRTNTFKFNNTSFDSNQISKIVKYKTTKAQIMKILGNPSGKYIYPLSKESNSFVYKYNTTAKTPFSKFEINAKSLIIEFNKKGIVIDINYTNNKQLI